MAVYTTLVRTLCENQYLKSKSSFDRDDLIGVPIDTIVNVAAPTIFTDIFPIWDESERMELEKRILKHFYFREIGMETPALWMFYLNNKMMEIMPYYVQLVKSIPDFESIFETVNTSEKHERDLASDKTHNDKGSNTDNVSRETLSTNEAKGKRTNKNNSEESGNNSNTTTNNLEDKTNGSTNENRTENSSVKFSDTPQNGINLTENNGLSYLTEYTVNNGTVGTTGSSDNTVKRTGTVSDSGSNSRTVNSDGTENTENNTTIKGTEETGTNGTFENSGAENENLNENIKITRTGFQGNRLELIDKYRKLMINVTELIIKDLSPLFIGIL